jgi:GAF domain-containing protein
MSAEVHDDMPTQPQQDATSTAAEALRAPAPEQALLYVPVDGAFRRIAKMAANAFEAPIATVSIYGDDRVWFPATEGLGGITQAPVDPAVIAELRRQVGPFVVDDARSDPRTADHPVVSGGEGVRFYVGAPIVSQQPQVLGTVEVMDRKKRRRVSDAQLALLTDLAATVAELLQIRVSALDALRSQRADWAAVVDRQAVEHRVAAQRSQVASAERDREQPEWCQLGGSVGCSSPADMKVADSWGDSAWGCWVHAEDALMQVPSVFLASESPVGLMTYRNRPSRPKLDSI